MSYHLKQGQAQKILDRHLQNGDIVLTITNVDEEARFRDSYVQVYVIEVAGADKPDYLLKIHVNGQPPMEQICVTNTITDEYNLLVHLHSRWTSNVIMSKFTLPIPLAIASTDGFPYVLLSRPRGRPANPGVMSRVEKIQFDHSVGCFLRLLHLVDGEFFGRPGTPTSEQQYAWQDAFVLALEEVLDQAQNVVGPELCSERIRGQLSRAIGSFLFDDVEWPSLVTTAADERSFLLSENNTIVCVLANGLHRALWGDPLMEHLFIQPTQALVMGYQGKQKEVVTDGLTNYLGNEGGDNWGLTVLPRQNTKMLWYRLYATLISMMESQKPASMGDLKLCIEGIQSAVYY